MTGCCFCDNQDITGEHVFPKWLSRKYPKNNDERHKNVEIDFLNLAPHFEEISNNKNYKGRIISKKIFCVCQSCNNGWMSEIERNVKYRLHNMINGVIFPLSFDLDFIRWICIKSIILSQNFNNHHITEHDRKLVRAGNLDYSRWRFWIGSTFAKPGLAAFSQSTAEVDAEINGSNITSNFTMSHLVCGNALFISVFSTKPNYPFKLTGSAADKLHQISHSSASVFWPNGAKLSLQETERMETMLSRFSNSQKKLIF